MSDSFIVAAIGVCWLAIGLVLAIAMGRRGHNSFGWLVVGMIMGPLGIVLAIDARRHDEQLRPAPLAPHRPSVSRRGPVDVLVGYDGSSESAAAVKAVVKLLGRRLGRLTVATVVSYGDVPHLERIAREKLQSLAGPRSAGARQFEILHGHPSVALAQRAAEGGYNLIAVGTRGAGLSKAILGSAASELARDSKVPVLVVGAPVEATVETTVEATSTALS